MDLRALVKEKCRNYPSVDPKLVDAIIQVESGYNPWAVRYEPKFTIRNIPDKYARMNGITVETERVLNKMSFGLGQIMGSTARWLGFQGPLTALCDPELNVTWMCKYLIKLKTENHVLENVIASYNAGSVRRDAEGKLVNQDYVDKVIAKLR